MMAEKVTRWAIFTVLFSLIPIVASYVVAVSKVNGALVPLHSVLEHGELYLLSSSFAAVGLGETIGINERWKIPKLITAGFSVLNLALSIALFVSANDVTGPATYSLATFSYAVFASSCVVATACIALSEIKDA